MVSLSGKYLPFTSLFFLAAMRFCASETFGVYWGFQSENEVSLKETCLSGRYRYVHIYRLTGFGIGRTPVLNIGTHCNASSSNGCTHLSSDIKICQDMGIKVMLSIGGADDVGYSWASPDDSKNVSLYLWNTFLGGQSSSYPRPFGNVTLDGIDLYQSYNQNLPTRLVEHYKGKHQYYLSTALSCTIWSSSGNPVAYSIDASVFSYISIEFFGETCAYYPGKAENVINTWNLWTIYLNVTLFLGLAATPNTSVGFVPADVLVSQILPSVKKSSNYGGMMLWSKSVDDKIGYSSSIENLSINSEPPISGASSPDYFPQPPPETTRRIALIVGATLGGIFSLILVLSFWFCLPLHMRRSLRHLPLLMRGKMKKSDEDIEEHLKNPISGAPTRFSYSALAEATENFTQKLGEGGFGSVFKGILRDGTEIAVKCLTGLGAIEKSFIAEVETIGSINHINLVRLIGYCAEKSHALLVYEYLCNGSLDGWIFNRNPEQALDWKTRRDIIKSIAKGLLYLHEGCRRRVIHLDIKPQNILLDENFNAKVADFGLSRLVDRGQNIVVTTMRGTPGYMAPEWQNAVISEKVDVYNFGIVLLEILCGRKNLDRSQPEECMHLLSLFKTKAEEEKLLVLDLVDANSEDMQSHSEEVLDMMMVAAWCLQNNAAKRPSMSVVLKCLEGATEVAAQLDYNFFRQPAMQVLPQPHILSVSSVLPSQLSGPR